MGVLLVVVLVYNYVYQDHRDIGSEVPAFTISAIELSKAFQNNETTATQTYLNQTVLVKGVVSSMDTETAMMKPGIFFALSENKNTSETLSFPTVLQIKGRCIGYDSILEEIKFDQAIMIN